MKAIKSIMIIKRSLIRLWCVSACVVLSLFGSELSLQAQQRILTEDEAATVRKEADKKIQKMERSSAKTAGNGGAQLANLSFRNFVRGGLMSGNLIQVPYVTNVNVSAGYWGSAVSPNKITWPKGSGNEYGHTMSFLFAGEVQDEAGNDLVIISDSYNRSGGDKSPDGSHKYFFQSIPGFYNMNGDPSTTNRLNNNPNDRAILEEAGFYYVGGLNEDANNNGVLDDGEDLNNNGELDIEMVNDLEYTAQSNFPQTWPTFWPPQSYVGDDRAENDYRPGSRAGRWNGAYGAYVRGDQESFYIADDRDNDEFEYYPFINEATGEPDDRSWEDGGRRGLGIEVDVRQYQWNSVLAEDIFISTFDVRNVSRFDINKSIIAMLVDYDIAGSTGDNQALFDTEDDITYQWLKRPLVRNGFKIGYAGVGFLESPGIDDDGIDNDSDGMIDESREDGIDNDGDWLIWTDVNGNGIYDNEDLNGNLILDDGEDLDGDGKLTIEPINSDTGSDGLGPEDEGYPGPDANGTEANGIPDLGEPNFEFTDNDEIDQIGLTNMVIRTPSSFDRDLDDDELFWRDYIQPVDETDFIVPTETADVIYVYSSGFTAVPKGLTQRFSMAFFCGNDFQDMLRNKRTMQNIYDSDYNFSKPPRTPFLTAVPGDKKVTLVWDQSAESSRDPIYGNDFEMYKVYRSTDPEFNDIKTITDAFGNPLLWEPLQTKTGDKVQYDLENGLSGAHPVQLEGFGISYDMGSDSGLKYSYVDSTVENGRTYYYAVVSVDQGYHESFFDNGISQMENLTPISPTESSKLIEVNAFEEPFNVDRNCAVIIPQAAVAGYVEPHLDGDKVEHTNGDADGRVQVSFLVPDANNTKGYEYEMTFTDDNRFYVADSSYLENGLTTGFTLKNVTTGEVLAERQLASASPKLFDTPILNAGLYDGMRISVSNPSSAQINEKQWIGSSAQQIRLDADVSARKTEAVPIPRDFEIRVAEAGVDTATGTNAPITNFSVYDVTNLNTPEKLVFSMEDARFGTPGDTVRGRLSPGDDVSIKMAPRLSWIGEVLYTKTAWTFDFKMRTQDKESMNEMYSELNTLYDSLTTYQVRKYTNRPFGGDLEGAEYYRFVRELNTWMPSKMDSLVGISEGMRQAVLAAMTPEDYLSAFEQLDRAYLPSNDQTYYVTTLKPFDRDDVVRFKVGGNELQENIMEDVLDNVYTVPDPYIGVNTLEKRNRYLSGRTERRIDFRNLPKECTIKIFTISGKLVQELHHNSSVDNSTEVWDMKTKDGLEVAFGVYIYHVDAPGIGQKIGRLSIIK